MNTKHQRLDTKQTNKQTNKPLDSEIFWKGPQKIRAVFIILIVLLEINHLLQKKTKKKKTS